MGYATRRGMWISVDGGWSGWFRTPNRGADMSPSGWAEDGTTLNGGGYALNSWGSHKRYIFEWPSSSSRDDAMFMQSLANGTYGRGLIHFVTPDTFDLNVLPARIADPSMAVDDEGASLVYGEVPEGVATSNWRQNNLPIKSAYYLLNNVEPGYRGPEDSVFIPIPTGYSLGVAAFYTAVGSGGLYYSPVSDNWTVGEPVLLTQHDNDMAQPILDMISGGQGIRLWIGKTEDTDGSITLAGIVARLISNDTVLPPAPGSGYGDLPFGVGPYGGDTGWFYLTNGWTPGMGNSGCRFAGKPTYVAETGTNGGQVGYAATFVEVGSFAY